MLLIELWSVLILILVDLPLRLANIGLNQNLKYRLNPYSGGFASQAHCLFSRWGGHRVLILILVDLPLRHVEKRAKGQRIIRLNPYSGGFASQAKRI